MIKYLILVLLFLPSCEEIARENRMKKEIKNLQPTFVDTQGRCWLLKDSGGKYMASLLVKAEC